MTKFKSNKSFSMCKKMIKNLIKFKFFKGLIFLNLITKLVYI